MLMFELCKIDVKLAFGLYENNVKIIAKLVLGLYERVAKIIFALYGIV